MVVQAIVRAVSMPLEERLERHVAMADAPHANSVFDWAATYLARLEGVSEAVPAA